MIFEILGVPHSKQSVRFGKNYIAYQTKALKDKENEVIKQLLIQKQNTKPIEKPVFIEYIFVYKYLKNTSKKAKEEIIYKTTAPDIDNLQKFINDCIKKADIIKDDNIIVSIRATKVYSMENKTFLKINEV